MVTSFSPTKLEVITSDNCSFRCAKKLLLTFLFLKLLKCRVNALHGVMLGFYLFGWEKTLVFAPQLLFLAALYPAVRCVIWDLCHRTIEPGLLEASSIFSLTVRGLADSKHHSFDFPPCQEAISRQVESRVLGWAFQVTSYLFWPMFLSERCT